MIQLLMSNSSLKILQIQETFNNTTIRASIPMYMTCRRIKALGIKICLTGEGSDELFGGYCISTKHQIEQNFIKSSFSEQICFVWGIETRPTFMIKQWIEYVMQIDPKYKMINAFEPYMEKYILLKPLNIQNTLLWHRKFYEDKKNSLVMELIIVGHNFIENYCNQMRIVQLRIFLKYKNISNYDFYYCIMTTIQHYYICNQIINYYFINFFLLSTIKIFINQMNNQYEFLSEIFQQWRNITQRQIKQRQSLMSMMYSKEQNLLKNVFQGWMKCWNGQKNYKYKRDLFYKKLLIFNYKYLLRKFFNGFIQNSKRLVTLHYKKEMANNFRSQQIKKLKSKILKAFIANVTTSQNIKQIQQKSLRLYFKLWNSETRKLQLKNKLNKEDGNLNNVEQWIQQKRQNRIQPKIYQETLDQQYSLPQQQTKNQTNEQKVQKQITPKKEQINEIQKSYIPDQINQTSSINELNQFLQLKMMEYEYYTSLPDKNINVIKQIKLEIKLTLEKIQQFRGQQ